jgi:hypothetical protein
MTIGELRKILNSVPDDALVSVAIGMSEYSEDLDAEYREYREGEDKGGAGSQKMFHISG